MNDDLETCERCGGTLELVARVGALHTFRCARCGFERHVHVSFIEPDRIQEKDISDVSLVLHWHTVPPSAAEIASLRRHFPELASVPLREFMARIGNARRFVIGTFLRVHAEALVAQMSDSGLDLRIEA